MIRSLTYITILCTVYVSHAQLVLKPVHSADRHNAPMTATENESRRVTQQTLTLPFWDDFSTSGPVPDSTKWESGKDVFVNATLGQNPPTYKVATFDGLKSTGKAYDISNNFNGPGDSLVSQPIDLSVVSPFNRNTVYLSFYWQVKGHGEIPEAGDSLRLQFLRHNDKTDSNEWVTKWVISGGSENLKENFTQKILQVDDERFFHDKFKFKFESFSSQRGPFDTWHIDYIYLNENRSQNNIYYQDRSLSGSPTALFAPYHEIPARHFYNHPEVSQQQVMATNLDSDPHPIAYAYQLKNETSDNTYYEYLSTEFRGFDGFNLAGKPIFPQDISLNITDEPSDSVVISSTFVYDTEDTFLAGLADINNTLTTYYTLHNHYAYDDGTAEFAAAINQRAGQVAMRYVLPEPDTITHIDIYFPSIAPESTGSTVDLLVWSRLSEAGERARQPHVIQGPGAVNQFTRVKLDKPFFARDTLYIGYQQYTDNFIGVGFDRSNASAKGAIFTNISDDWNQNERLEGVLMIRPVFKSPDSTTVILNSGIEPTPIAIYPNPSSGLLKIKGRYDHVSIHQLSGKLVHQSVYKEEHDLRFLENGLYLIRVLSGSTVVTKKLLISR